MNGYELMGVKTLAAAGLTALVAVTGVHAGNAPGAPHVAIVIDSSGSMKGKLTGFGRMLDSLAEPAPNPSTGYSPLDAAVYSVMSFEYDQDLQVDPVAPQPAGRIAKRLRQMHPDGGREDGYAALEAMLGELQDRPLSSVWLVTDEWRNVKATPVDFDGLLRLLEQRNVALHAIVRADFSCEFGARAFGIVADGSGPAQADSSDWYVCPRVEVRTAPSRERIEGADKTVEEYVKLALASGGSAWDLEALARGVPAAADAFALYQANALLQAASSPSLQPAVQLATPAVVAGPVVLEATTSAPVSSYAWDLDGDGATDASGAVITHHFPEPGRYRVIVRVEDRGDATAWASFLLTLDN